MPEHALPTPETLALVREHLARFGPDPANELMLERLSRGVASPYDQAFLDHELAERRYMDEDGLGYDEAHRRALDDEGVSPFALYDTSVVGALPESFNAAWRRYHGLEG
jgi:hypothetical protein